MSKSEIYWHIAGGFVGIGIIVYLLVPLDYAHPDIGIYIFAAIFSAVLSIWCFTLPYCFTYRIINNITCANGKFRFSCSGKSFEDKGCIFLKFKLHSEESLQTPTHMFVLLKNGPWICPYVLWKDRIENKF